MYTTKTLASIALLWSSINAQQNPRLSSLSSDCLNFPASFPPTESLYASQYCRICTSLGLTPSIEPCCSNSNPPVCFATNFYRASLTAPASSAPITVAPPALTGPANCNSIISIFQTCNAATPGFSNLCFRDQQSCYCSTSGTAAPSRYDDYFSSCLAWASANEPASYSLLGPDANGNVQSRKCQTYSQFIATGGTPGGCLTSASPTFSSGSTKADARPTAISAPKSSNFAPRPLPMGVTGVLVSIVQILYVRI